MQITYSGVLYSNITNTSVPRNQGGGGGGGGGTAGNCAAAATFLYKCNKDRFKRSFFPSMTSYFYESCNFPSKK